LLSGWFYSCGEYRILMMHMVKLRTCRELEKKG
jgi:hypothetical protein